MWREFLFTELTEVMRQRGDSLFIQLLNQIRIGEPTPEDEDVFQSRSISKNNRVYPINELHMFAENAPAQLHNDEMLTKINSTLYSILAIDDLPPDKIPARVIDQVLSRSQSETGGLSQKLDIKVDARVMLTSNISIGDRLTNGQIGTIVHVLMDNHGNVFKIYVKFDDEKAGETMKKSTCYAMQHNCVPIEKIEVKIRVYQHSEFPVIKRTQFPLKLSWACTIHKVQGLTLPKAVLSFSLIKQRSFNPGQMYVVLSRVASLDGLFLTGKYNRNVIKADQKATEEYQILRDKYPFKPLTCFQLNTDNLIITLLNTRSLIAHSVDISAHPVLLQSDLICLTETQISTSAEERGLQSTLKDFDAQFNNNEDKF